MKNIGTILLAALIIWVVGSWMEIDSKNKMPDPEYSSINFFTLWD